MDNPLDSDSLQGAPVPAPRPAAAPNAAPEAIAEAAAQPKASVSGGAKKRGLHPALIALIVLAVVVGGVAAAWKFGGMGKKPLAGIESAARAEAPAGPLAPYAKGSIAHMMTFATPRQIDDLTFIDRDKKPVKLSDFKGQVVVLNLWATWCAPCRFEMPTLASLQAHYAGKGVKVLPLSGDSDDKFADVQSFIDVQEPLDVYVDSGLISKTSKLGVVGLPATIILDKQGREVARLDGEATWDTPEVKALLDKLLAE